MRSLKNNVQLALRPALILLPSLWVLYVVGVFLFLNTPLFQLLTQLNSQDFDLRYRVAWSVIPGLVELRDAKLKIQDDVVDLDFNLPKVTALFNLGVLKDKEVNFRDLQILGLSFKLRLKSKEESKSYPKNPDPRPVAQRREENWKTRFQKIQISEVDSLDVNGLILKGQIMIKGGFYLQPGVDLAVGPAELSIESGSLAVKNPDGTIAPFAEKTVGQLQMSLERFILTENPGSNVLRHLNTTARFDSEISHVRFLNGFLINAPSVLVDNGKGVLKADFSIKDGFINHPSRVLVTSPQVEIKAVGLALSGSGTLSWSTLLSPANQTSGQLLAKLNSFTMRSAKQQDLLLHGSKVAATATTSNLDLVKPFSNLLLRLEIPSAKAPQLSRFYKKLNGTAIVDADIKAFAGTADTIRPKNLTSHARLRFNQAHLVVNKNHVSANGEVKLGFSSIDLAKQRGNLDSARAEIKDITITNADGSIEKQVEPWWINASLNQAQFKLEDLTLFEAQTHIAMKDAILPIKALGLESKLSALQKLALPKGRIEVGTFLSMTSEFISIYEIKAQTSGLTAQGNLTFGVKGLDGALLIRALNLVGVGLKMKQTEMDFAFPANDAWLIRHTNFNKKSAKSDRTKTAVAPIQ